MDYKTENKMNQNHQQQYSQSISVQPIPQVYPQIPTAQSPNNPYPTFDNHQNKNPKRDWSFGLFDCCHDLEALLCAYFCTPCFMYKIFERAGEGCCDCFCAGLVPLRTKIRTERAIQGSLCEDAFAVACCPLCVMVQISNEMK
ncbi:unnamed protein product, partial [Brachionus calyciflorus]